MLAHSALGGLFDADFHVTSFDGPGLHKAVLDGSERWVVMFYVPWYPTPPHTPP